MHNKVDEEISGTVPRPYRSAMASTLSGRKFPKIHLVYENFKLFVYFHEKLASNSTRSNSRIIVAHNSE